jgi:hypothetical protein
MSLEDPGNIGKFPAISLEAPTHLGIIDPRRSQRLLKY